ncbi:MAG: OsmC family protein [Bacteroidota bacterium]
MEVINTPTTHTYSVAMKWDEETKNGTMTSGTRMPVLFAPPVEFGGTDTVWSPEQLLASAVASCYMTTLLHFANILKIKICEIRVGVKMEIEKQKLVGFVATKYFLNPKVKFASIQSQRIIDDLLSKAKRYCIVSNSVTGEIIVDPEIVNR